MFQSMELFDGLFNLCNFKTREIIRTGTLSLAVYFSCELLTESIMGILYFI